MQIVTSSQNFSGKTLAVVIARFSMLHNEHVRMLKEMAKENTHLLILIGSANRRKSNKNPFDFIERKRVLEHVLATFTSNYSIVPLFDNLYKEARWESEVQRHVYEFAVPNGIHDSNVTLYGQDKDQTTYYLKKFPQWKRRDLGVQVDIDATRLRDEWFANEQKLGNSILLDQHLPPQMKIFLEHREFDTNAQRDYRYYLSETEKFKDYPYQDTLSFICVDAIIECAGHILTVTRANEHGPGYGCRALPGGFKERNLSLFDSVIKEIYEETNLRVSEKTLRLALRKQHVFDHPARNNGIPRVTHGFYFKLEPRDDHGNPPRAKGGDDAKATWLPNNGVDWIPTGHILSAKEIMYDDHPDMVEYFV